MIINLLEIIALYPMLLRLIRYFTEGSAMKRKSRVLVIVFAIMLILMTQSLTAFALTKQDGLEVEVNTDKGIYTATDTIAITTEIKNTNNYAIENITIEGVLPKGITALENVVLKDQIKILEPGAKSVFTINAQKGNSIIAVDSPKTGQDIAIGTILITLIILSLFILLISSKKHPNVKKMMVFILCLSVMMPFLSSSKISASGDTESKKIEVSKTISISDREYQYKSIVTYDVLSTTPQISLDTAHMKFTQSDDIDFYTIDEKINVLNGYLTYSDHVETMSFELKSTKDIVLMSGSIPVSDNWEINNFGLVIGGNILEITAITYNGEKIERTFHLINNVTKNSNILNISYDIDTDNDNIPDYYEEYYGFNKNKKDTDGDGLPDGIELSLGTDPKVVDTDENGINDGDEDYDKDGITNLQELNIGTDPTSNDSDLDGLYDGDELNKYNTDPKRADTDGDGVNDGLEVEIGSNPLIFNNTFKRTISTAKDNTRPTVATVVVDGLTNNQVASLSVVPVENDLFLTSDIPGYIDNGYNFYVDGEFDKATISFEIDNELLSQENFTPAIYYFNEETQLLEELDDQVLRGNIISAQVTHFSKYILLNKIPYDKVWDTDIKKPGTSDVPKTLDIAFVIDSSGSMAQNDSKGLRRTLSINFINKMQENDRACIVDFDSSSYVLSKFTSDKTTLENAVNRIDSQGGTNIYGGIRSAINEFDSITTDNNKLKVLFVLTDGSDSPSIYTQDEYILLAEEAKSKGICIYTVGLGNVNRELLTRVAEKTEGKFYYATEADELYNIFDLLQGETIDYLTDTNNDGISDYFTKLLCEGKLLTGVGRTLFKGIDYKKIQANDDYDGDGLKNGEEIIVAVSGDKVYVSLNSDPTMKDSDSDGITDKDDPFPLRYDSKNKVVFQTKGKKGIDSTSPNSKLVSKDLTFNDYSYKDLLALSKSYKNADINEWWMWSEISVMVGLISFSKNDGMKTVVQDMFDVFRYANKVTGIKCKAGDNFNANYYLEYSNSVLTQNVRQHENTKNFINDFKKGLIREIKRQKGILNDFNLVNFNKYIQNNVKMPRYGDISKLDFEGLGLAIHGWQGVKVSITDYSISNKEFQGKIHFSFYDHFGLDNDDYTSGKDAMFGFIDWFTLQHYTRFKGIYRPFITTVDFDVEFNGQI